MSEAITRQQVIELIDTLPSETLPELAQFAEFLRSRARPRDSRRVAAEEQSLRQVIQRQLAPEQQHRLDLLRQKSEAGRLTDAERAELLAMVEQIEKTDAQRAQALVDLARLRHVPVAVLIREFALEPSPDAS
jgi:hypothetical protein